MQVREMFANQAVVIDGPDVDIDNLAYDSRRVRPKTLFAALTGVRHDGHAHIEAALESGASAVLCERAVPTQGATRICSDNARRSLALAAQVFYGDPSRHLITVGITGTNGKTTTAHLIAGMLEREGMACGTIGTLGARYTNAEGEAVLRETGLTTPESVDAIRLLREMLDEGVRGVAMEVSSHALVQHRADGIAFDVGVFTNLTQDHLDYHETLDAYFEAKTLLVRERLKPRGRPVLNLDDPRVASLYDTYAGDAVAFSVKGDERARVRLGGAERDRDGMTLEVVFDGAPHTLRSPLVGGFNIENLLAAAATGIALGHAPQDVVRNLGEVRGVPGRLERVSQPGEPLVLVDYAHTPDALRKALAAVRQVTEGRVICVFGCGGDRDPHKRAPMGQVVGEDADVAIVTNDNPRNESPELIAEAVLRGLSNTPLANSARVELDRAAAINVAIRMADEKDTVLIAGKGHETSQTISGVVRHFDDRQEARRVLDTVKRGDGRSS